MRSRKRKMVDWTYIGHDSLTKTCVLRVGFFRVYDTIKARCPQKKIQRAKKLDAG